jgi:predicted DNA-binding protein (MmcQ/YjbR family)
MAPLLTFDALQAHCSRFEQVTLEFPFDARTLVFKVAGKIFALCDVEDFRAVNVKCDPEQALMLREQFAAVKPGYHMNKRHWNTVEVDSDASAGQILQWVTDSYHLVAPNKRIRPRSNGSPSPQSSAS